MIGPSQRLLPDNTQHLQETDIQAPSGIRTCNPMKRVAQTYSLDRVTSGIGVSLIVQIKIWTNFLLLTHCGRVTLICVF